MLNSFNFMNFNLTESFGWIFQIRKTKQIY